MSSTQSARKPRLRVAVCGGGIAGLCLTLAVLKYEDIEVNVYEAAGSFKEIGAGVMVWGRSWEILTRMGLEKELRAAENVPTDGLHDPVFGFEYRQSSQPEEGFLWYSLKLPYTCILFHRARFLDVLVKHLPDRVANLRKRLSDYSRLSSGEYQLQFADGSTATCDVLLGCDGVRSVVRRRMFEDEAKARGQPALLKHIEPFFSGTVAYRVLVPVERLLEVNGKLHPTMKESMMYCGKGKHIVSYGIAGGALCNIVGLVSDRSAEGKEYKGPWVEDSSPEELLQCFAGWEPEVQDLLKCVHPKKPLKWAVHQLHPLPFYVSGNVALLGDAAHAMTPHEGAGAGQAIEDAYVLAQLLGHPETTLDTLPRVLKAYNHVRRPMGNYVLEGSRVSGAMYDFESRFGDDYEVLGPAIQKQFGWVSEPNPDAQVERALTWCYETKDSKAKL